MPKVSLFFPHDHKENHVKALDGLRGLAVLLVLFDHLSRNNLWLPVNFFDMGKIGVYLFYMLSAYLLDKQIIDVMVANKNDSSYWKYYFFRRFVRIYPLFIISLFLYYFISEYYMQDFIPSLKIIMHHLLLQKGRLMYWSIPVEFKYYFFSPVLLWFFKQHHWRSEIVISVLLALILLASICNFVIPDILSTINFLAPFLIGTLFAYLEKFHPQINYQKMKSFIFLCVAVLALGLPYYWYTYLDIYLPFNNFDGILLVSFILSGIFIGARYSFLKKIFQWKPLRFIGNISFSLYLLHFAVLNFFRTYNPGEPYWNSLFTITGSILLATISYLILELPLSKLKLRKRYKTGIITKD